MPSVSPPHRSHMASRWSHKKQLPLLSSPPLSFFPFSSLPPLSFFTSFLSIPLPSFFLLSPSLICPHSLTRVYLPLILPLVPLQVPTLCSEQRDGQKPRDQPRMFPAGHPASGCCRPSLVLILDKLGCLRCLLGACQGCLPASWPHWEDSMVCPGPQWPSGPGRGWRC